MWLKHLIHLTTTPITQFLIFLSQIFRATFRAPPFLLLPPPPQRYATIPDAQEQGKTIFPQQQDKNNGKYSRNIVEM